MSKQFTSVFDMEAAACTEEDSRVSIKIRGHYLEIECGNVHEGNFIYRWGKNEVTREVAENIFATR